MNLRSNARLLVSVIALASVTVVVGCGSDTIDRTAFGKPCSSSASCDDHLTCEASDVDTEDGGVETAMFCEKICVSAVDCQDVTCESILSVEHPACGSDHFCYCTEHS